MSEAARVQSLDFSQFGETECVPLTKIQRLTGAYLSRNWSTIPHVTQHDDLDVTELEQIRSSHGAKVTTLSYVIKAVALVLKEERKFNASLDTNGSDLILKKYVNVGVAVDTPNGLLVPVIRDCDRRSIEQIAADIGRLAAQARSKGLPMSDISGGCFSVSSLGRTGGTGFTPIINAPEVAILGLSSLQDRPRRGVDESIQWRNVLPASLSYDHRVINGVDAARFLTRIKSLLAAPDTLLS